MMYELPYPYHINISECSFYCPIEYVEFEEMSYTDMEIIYRTFGEVHLFDGEYVYIVDERRYLSNIRTKPLAKYSLSEYADGVRLNNMYVENRYNIHHIMCGAILSMAVVYGKVFSQYVDNISELEGFVSTTIDKFNISIIDGCMVCVEFIG